jgi:hypothetical protein
MHISKLTLVVVLFLAIGCSSPPSRPPADSAPTAARPATFVNRVWRVAQSSAVAPGTLYVFLSDGTLVVTSPGSKALLGTWSRSGSGLVMVEDSLSYQVDILELDADEFVIRSHNPGEPVDITMVPAEGGDDA